MAKLSCNELSCIHHIYPAHPNALSWPAEHIGLGGQEGWGTGEAIQCNFFAGTAGPGGVGRPGVGQGKATPSFYNFDRQNSKIEPNPCWSEIIYTWPILLHCPHQTLSFEGFQGWWFPPNVATCQNLATTNCLLASPGLWSFRRPWRVPISHTILQQYWSALWPLSRKLNLIRLIKSD